MARRAVFLDRDGTLCDDVGPVSHFGQLSLYPWIPSALSALSQLEYDIAIVTNQSAVARGLVSYAQVEEVHADLTRALARRGISLLDIRFCPHHPEGVVPRYRGSCGCRKPEPGMILEILERYDLDPKQSWMVGDNITDIAAGQRAGCHTALVRTGHGVRDQHKVGEGVPVLSSLRELPSFIARL